MNSALVTGADGRLGRLLVELLEKHGFSKVYRTDGLDLTRDVQALFEILASTQVTAVFHTAAVTPPESVRNFYRANVQMAVTVTEAIARIPSNARPTLINFSSAAEIGSPPDHFPAVSESHLCEPCNPYGASKLCQTEIALAASRYHSFRCICPRIFNFLWLPGTPEPPVQSWINQVKMIREGSTQPVVSVGDLKIGRDLIDPIEALSLIVDLALCPEAEGIINIGSGEETRLDQAFEVLKDLSGLDLQPEVNPSLTSTRTPRRVVADVRKLESLLKRKAVFDLERSMTQMLREKR